ncbi:hypothetical protein PYW07_005709 [Mythimna separata]|uniref:Uncharacterized protein n=1 Tax=Mythimna separata TaxID=271217 RepID=A0AAD8DR70_MYTSE|nr:hypothetical protein PYW07_005709 [Mythimna separata]
MNVTPTIFMPEFDQINHLVNIKIPDERQIEDSNLTISMTSLGEAIEKLKKSDSEIDDISPHDIHQYVVCYVLLSIATCVAAAWLWRTGRCRLCRGAAAGHRGEGAHQQQTTVTPPPPKPRRHSRHQEFAAALTPKPARRHEPYSEVLSAKDLSEKSEISFRLHDCAKRWPSAKYSAIKRGKNINTDNRNIDLTLDDSLV